MAGNAENIMLGPVALFWGTAGTAAATSMGYTDEKGGEFFPDIDSLDVKAGEKLGIVKQFAIEKKGMFSCALIEMTLANLRNVLPGATLSDANTLDELVASTAMRQISFKAVGLNALGNVRSYEMLYCTGKLKKGIALSARELAMLECEFNALGVGSKLWTIKDGSASNIKTISSGTFARTDGEAYYRMAGEGAAADALTNITGTFADGEMLILQIADESQPITITHASDTIELDGAVDWIMTKATDVLYLQYQSTGTQFVELGRTNSL